MVPAVIGALGAVTSELGEWLQCDPRICDIRVQNKAVLGMATLQHRAL